MGFLYVPQQLFKDFTQPGSDRFSLLLKMLAGFRLDPHIINMAGSRHICISSPNKSSREPINVLIAHYDCVPGSPGANDNAAAVFQLVHSALGLKKDRKYGWHIIFTDKEECGAGAGIKSQGAYALATGFRDLGLDSGRFFILDVCGRGDTLVISTTVDSILKQEEGPAAQKSLRKIRNLRSAALEAARDANIQNTLLLPTPFSDDAGFLAAGLSAQTISMLPEKEAKDLASLVRRQPALASLMINRDARKTESCMNPDWYPETWNLINSEADTRETLTAGSSHLVQRLIQYLIP